MPTNLRHITPYGSIHMRVPDFWQEDASNPREGIVYVAHGALAGPFRVRREDFVLESNEDAAFNMGEFRGVTEEEHGTAFMRTFSDMYAKFAGPDILARDIEPEQDGHRMFCYVKKADENGETLLVHGWMRGIVTGPNSFVVVSFTMAVPEAVVRDDAVKQTIGILDREIRGAEILSIGNARQLARDTLAEQLGQYAGDAATATESKRGNATTGR